PRITPVPGVNIIQIPEPRVEYGGEIKFRHDTVQEQEQRAVSIAIAPSFPSLKSPPPPSTPPSQELKISTPKITFGFGYAERPRSRSVRYKTRGWKNPFELQFDIEIPEVW
ncbi:MAG: hypothetical protein NZ911_07175, partial [Sulfolobales archaeon]|nr:hypothetical protein [Sulfolobales archaeon]